MRHHLLALLLLLGPWPAFSASNAPVIVSHPLSQTVIPGSTIVLSVTATGDFPLFFQWYHNAQPKPGATNSTLVITNIQAPAAGDYYAQVANSNGVATSTVARITVAASYTLNLPAGFSFVANHFLTPTQGFPPVPDGTIAYHWNASLQQYSDAFTFVAGIGWTPGDFIVQPGEGALLNLPVPAALTFVGETRPSPLPLSMLPGFNLVSAQAPKPSTFDDIMGFPPADGTVMYRYRTNRDPNHLDYDNFRIHLFKGGAWHDTPPVVKVGEAVFVTLADPVVIANHPFDTTVPPGGTAVFNVIANGTGPLSYQWRRNGQDIPGETNSMLMVLNVEPASAGSYSVVVMNVLGAVSSQPALLKIDVPPWPFMDFFLDQMVIPFSQHVLVGSNIAATAEPGEPRHAGHRPMHSVWTTWIAPFDGIATFETLGSSFDSTMAVYSGDSISNLVLVAADDDSDGFHSSRLTFNAEANKPYRIAIDSVGGAPGNIVLAWDLEPTPDRLPDLIFDLDDITVRPGDMATFSIATSAANAAYLWFFNGTAIATTGASLTISNVSPVNVGTYYVKVFSGGRVRESRRATLQLFIPSPGGTLQDARGTAKFFELPDIMNAAGFPPNLAAPGAKASRPKLGGSTAHGYSGSQVFSTAGAGKEPGEPNHCGYAGGNSYWYAVQAETNGTMFMNTDGSTFDTVLAVYIGPGDSFVTLTNVACDNNSGLDGLDSSVSFPATKDTIYWIAVDGIGGASGTVRLRYQLIRPLTMTNWLFSSSNNNGRLVFRVNSTPNVVTSIETTTNLANWSGLITNSNASGIITYTNTNSLTASNRLFRAVNRF
jgi:hypothetical protein